MGQHSVGIDTAFATKSDTPTHNFGVLVQASRHALQGHHVPKYQLLHMEQLGGAPLEFVESSDWPRMMRLYCTALSGIYLLLFTIKQALR